MSHFCSYAGLSVRRTTFLPLEGRISSPEPPGIRRIRSALLRSGEQRWMTACIRGGGPSAEPRCLACPGNADVAPIEAVSKGGQGLCFPRGSLARTHRDGAVAQSPGGLASTGAGSEVQDGGGGMCQTIGFGVTCRVVLQFSLSVPGRSANQTPRQSAGL